MICIINYRNRISNNFGSLQLPVDVPKLKLIVKSSDRDLIRLMFQCNEDDVIKYKLESCILLLGSMAAVWMLMSMLLKERKKTPMDSIFVVIASSNFTCCVIKACCRWNCLSKESNNEPTCNWFIQSRM